MAFTFPTWIKRIRDPQAQASARLRYMLMHALLEHNGDTRLSYLARDVGFDHSTLSCALQRGRMSYEMAHKIAAKMGHQLINPEYLMDPLSA